MDSRDSLVGSDGSYHARGDSIARGSAERARRDGRRLFRRGNHGAWPARQQDRRHELDVPVHPPRRAWGTTAGAHPEGTAPPRGIAKRGMGGGWTCRSSSASHFQATHVSSRTARPSPAGRRTWQALPPVRNAIRTAGSRWCSSASSPVRGGATGRIAATSRNPPGPPAADGAISGFKWKANSRGSTCPRIGGTGGCSSRGAACSSSASRPTAASWNRARSRKQECRSPLASRPALRCRPPGFRGTGQLY